jgi:hypothetical protein
MAPFVLCTNKNCHKTFDLKGRTASYSPWPVERCPSCGWIVIERCPSCGQEMVTEPTLDQSACFRCKLNLRAVEYDGPNDRLYSVQSPENAAAKCDPNANVSRLRDLRKTELPSGPHKGRKLRKLRPLRSF